MKTFHSKLLWLIRHTFSKAFLLPYGLVCIALAFVDHRLREGVVRIFHCRSDDFRAWFSCRRSCLPEHRSITAAFRLSSYLRTFKINFKLNFVAGAGFEPTTSRLWAWHADLCVTPQCIFEPRKSGALPLKLPRQKRRDNARPNSLPWRSAKSAEKIKELPNHQLQIYKINSDNEYQYIFLLRCSDSNANGGNQNP